MTYGELIETEVEQTPEDAAESLRDLAAQIEAGGELTIESGTESVTVDAPEGVLEVEIELEREPEDDETDEIELELELEWDVEKAPERDEEDSASEHDEEATEHGEDEEGAGSDDNEDEE